MLIHSRYFLAYLWLYLIVANSIDIKDFYIRDAYIKSAYIKRFYIRSIIEHLGIYSQLS